MKWLQALATLLLFVWVMFGVFIIVVASTHPAVGKVRDFGMTQRVKISTRGLEHIKHFEGLRLKSYYCVAGRCTIGYGHAGPEVKPGMVITEERAEELLRQDLAEAEKAVSELVKVPLRQGQADALIDFTYNLGRNALAQSTLLKLLNRGEYKAASDQLMRWVHSGSAVISGLQRRRLAARAMWEERA